MDERWFAGRFRAVERLDRGGAAETYRVVDDLGNQFAVDVLHPADAAETQQLSDSLGAVAAVVHPNVPRVFEWGVDNGGFYVIREFVDGWDLTTLLARGPLDALRVARYGAEAALGLAAAHAAGCLHGSLRTSEIMVTPEGAVKVLGLGETLPRVLAPEGPPAAAHFLAPEQIRGEAPTEATDIYALGVVLYEGATNSVPLEAETSADVAVLQLEKTPELPRRVNPGVPPSLEVVVMRALEKQPRDRYRTMDEMRQDLDRVADQIQSGITAEAGTGKVKKKRPWWVWAIIAAIIVALVAGAGVGGYLWWRKNMTKVPTLRGLTPEAARTSIEGAGLIPGAVIYTPTATAGLPEGVIATQSPLPGGFVRVGTSIGVVINGPQRVTVPKLTGSTQAAAINGIQAAGLALAAINQAYNAAAAGTVISQTPTTGAEVPKGTGVSLGVSKGPQLGVVPSVLDQSEASAQSALTGAGFKMSASKAYSETVTSGSVVSQSPQAGSNAAVGTSVAVVVSQGAQPVTVQDTVGQSVGSAVNTLQGLGLKVNLSAVSVDATVATATGYKINPQIGKIQSQSPKSVTAPKGSPVNLTYGQP